MFLFVCPEYRAACSADKGPQTNNRAHKFTSLRDKMPTFILQQAVFHVRDSCKFMCSVKWRYRVALRYAELHVHSLQQSINLLKISSLVIGGLPDGVLS